MAVEDPVERSAALAAGSMLGPYRIVGPLGEGGMGKVFRALDTRLGRAVAIKVSAEQFGQRFEREARVISALNHPHICTLYDVGSLPSGSGYMVTELIEGETLRDWLKRAPDVERNVEIARQVLEALRAAHRAGIVHRDLKPANIMLRSDGYVKVLDFGLAKQISPAKPVPIDDTATLSQSIPGQILGTVAYLSPEQIQGQEVDARSDLFALGIILYEMLTGKHPWRRSTPVDTLHAILREDPPPIRSSPQLALGIIVQKLLRKNSADRYASAQAVLEALAAPAALSGADAQPASAVQPGTRPPTRLIVLPFRILRHHEGSDFLAVSLPDAITSSLGAIDSLVVRSSVVASRFTGPGALDVKKIAEEAQVDAILTGTLISDGERLQVNAQLVEASDGALLWSHTSKMPVRDVFQLQDELVDRIVQSLALPLTSREQRALKHDAPANAIAYELYLRAGQLAVGYGAENMTLARDLYLRSLEADPRYAPAWACLGRIYRIIGKYGIGDLAENLSLAEDAFQKSFALHPDLALAHNYYTALQTDLGRSLEAVERLLKRANAHRNDPNLFAGLVHACRYSGLLEASATAHQLAERLDPNIRTTVPYTYHYLGEYQKALDCCRHGDYWVKVASLVALGRTSEAIAVLLEVEKSPERVPQHYFWAFSWRAFLEGDRPKSLEALNQALALDGPAVRDAEGCLFIARALANLSQTDRALDLVSRALDQGYRCHHALVHDPWLEALRSHPRFTGLLERAAALDRRARTVFRENSGARVLEVAVGFGEGQRTDGGDAGR